MVDFIYGSIIRQQVTDLSTIKGPQFRYQTPVMVSLTPSTPVSGLRLFCGPLGKQWQPLCFDNITTA